MFQSAAGPKPGRDPCCSLPAAPSKGFNPRPGRSPAETDPWRVGPSVCGVSIRGRAEARPRRAQARPDAADAPVSIRGRAEARPRQSLEGFDIAWVEVSIRGRAEARPRLSDTSTTPPPLTFQSAAGPKPGRDGSRRSPVSSTISFNPRPGRSPAETTTCSCGRRGHRSFNPRPGRSPAETMMLV